MHIQIISKLPCDTEDWSNDAENSHFILHEQNKNKKIFKSQILF